MKKKILFLLLCAALLGALAVPAAAADTGEAGSFVLTAVNANSVIIEPCYIPYTQEQTIREALLATDHDFEGLKQGFIYAINGISGNFHLFYDGNEYDLEAIAAESDISVLCIGVDSQYSEELLALIARMAEYRQMGTVRSYEPAQAAYKAGLTAIRNGNAERANEVLNQLNDAIEAYNGLFQGPEYTVSVTAVQGDSALSAPRVELSDIYGNVTAGTGSVKVIAGTYSFTVSDGGYNRTVGTLTVAEDTALTVTLPAGEWFGDVKLLDANKNAYPYVQDTAAHTAVFQIPDTAKELSSLYLNVGQGAVPDGETTALRTVYRGTNGELYGEVPRSWESTATALTYLVKPGMAGKVFDLEARYTGADGYTQIQSYAMTIERTPTLASLTVTADGTVLPVAFDPLICNYDVVTVSDTLDIAASSFGADYTIQGTGLRPVSEHITVSVSHGGKATDYTLNITRKDSVAVTLTAKDGVTVQVQNAAGSVIAPVEGVYRLIPGESYTYLATKQTLYHARGSFTASAGLNVAVAEPITEDWLTDLALYDGSNSSIRRAYPADSPFSGADHDYVYQLSDCNTTVYIQATSDMTVTALYSTQTTSSATHNTPKTIVVDKAVAQSGAAKILTQATARSGYSNCITLRVSRESGGVTYYQDYELTLAKALHLTAMAAETAGDETLPLLDADKAVIAFDRDVLSYHVSVNRDETEVYITGTFPNTDSSTDCCGGYYAMVGGSRYETLDKLPVTLNSELDEERIGIQICHGDEAAVETTYTLVVKKTDPVSIAVKTEPENAVVFLTNDLNGKRIFGDESGIYRLTPGGSYTYTVTAPGYVGQKGSYTVPAEAAALSVTLEEAPANTALQQLSSWWPHLRQNADNNGVISAKTPIDPEDAVLYWATKIGDGYDKNACGCPILVDGYLYTYAGTTLYKVDTLTGTIVATAPMERSSSFAINPPTYADGMIFVGLADGTVQAFNAATLESLWVYHDPLKGQPNSSIVYHDGYVYTGFWVGEDQPANFVCLTAADEDPTQSKEEKLATWSYTSMGGFYWAGAYVGSDYLLVGTDDGASGYLSGYPRLLSFDPRTGRLLDQWQMDVVGDIRSSITQYNGKYYFTNKGGYFFEAAVSSAGDIESVKMLKLYNYASDDASPPMSTCTPVIHNGRAYVGVSGVNQFGAYSGHNITVIDMVNWEIAYTVRTQGYPQTSGVLTTGYDGAVYVYFVDNYTPGKLRVLKDRPGQTAPEITTAESYTDKGVTKTYETAQVLFTPSADQAQYAICSPIVDANGTLYFKNDSAYLMAVGSTIENLEITAEPDKLTYREGEIFDSTGMKVTAHYTNGLSRDVTEYVTWYDEPLTADDGDFVISFPCVMYQDRDGEAGMKYPEPFAALTLKILATGDVNGDGLVDMNDVSAVLQKDAIVDADLNGDKAVDEKDAEIIQNIINGMESTDSE